MNEYKFSHKKVSPTLVRYERSVIYLTSIFISAASLTVVVLKCLCVCLCQAVTIIKY